MERVDPHQGLMPSILDRLTDPATAGIGGKQGFFLTQMLESVRADLEELLNTRQTLGELGVQRERLRNSVLGYGLPEISSLPAVTPSQRQEIAQLLRATVARHEPRLRDVRVTLLEGNDAKAALHFRIDARLVVDPAPEVSFDSVVETSTGKHTVVHSEKGE